MCQFHQHESGRCFRRMDGARDQDNWLGFDHETIFFRTILNQPRICQKSLIPLDFVQIRDGFRVADRHQNHVAILSRFTNCLDCDVRADFVELCEIFRDSLP